MVLEPKGVFPARVKYLDNEHRAIDSPLWTRIGLELGCVEQLREQSITQITMTTSTQCSIQPLPFAILQLILPVLVDT